MVFWLTFLFVLDCYAFLELRPNEGSLDRYFIKLIRGVFRVLEELAVFVWEGEMFDIQKGVICWIMGGIREII